MSLYHKYRPLTLKDVVGQAVAVKVLTAKLADKTLPNVILFVGPTGVGKTTCARIVANEVGCTVNNLREINCADFRGIDNVRDITKTMVYRGLDGGCRVWILDEVVQLPKMTQQAFLKELEDTPEYIYFLLCTTSLEGLLPTFVSRCFVINLNLLTEAHIDKVVTRVVQEENAQSIVGEAVYEVIPANAGGSARKALQLLEAALAVRGEADQLQAVAMASASEEKEVEFLAKALLRRASWKELQPVLQRITSKEAEGIRWAVLEYISKVMIYKDQDMCNLIIRAFEGSFAQCGRAGLMAAVWGCCQNKSG